MVLTFFCIIFANELEIIILLMSRPKVRPTVYELKKDNHFVVKISANTSDELPDVVFLRGKVRVTPLLSNKLYENDILHIKNEFEKYAKYVLSLFSEYDKNYIFSIDISEKSVRYKKISHLKYEIYLKPKQKKPLAEEKERLVSISNKMENKLIELFQKHDLIWK